MRQIRRQRGATLLIGLIMLVLLTLRVVTAFNLSRSNLKAVGNMQTHNEAVATARSAVEEVLSKTDFSVNPTAAFGTGNTKTYDLNGDGTADVSVSLVPQPCIKSYQILPVDPNDTTALGCASSVQQNFGIAGSATWGAQCADIVWEVTAVATDNVTGANATVGQGILVRQDANAAVNSANFCP
jgi:Tfp pilus assembly protein PilX